MKPSRGAPSLPSILLLQLQLASGNTQTAAVLETIPPERKFICTAMKTSARIPRHVHRAPATPCSFSSSAQPEPAVYTNTHCSPHPCLLPSCPTTPVPRLPPSARHPAQLLKSPSRRQGEAGAMVAKGGRPSRSSRDRLSQGRGMVLLDSPSPSPRTAPTLLSPVGHSPHLRGTGREQPDPARHPSLQA